MNLTDPPAVDDLSPRRRDELRSGLVDHATDTIRPHPRRSLIPVLAATAAVATVAAAVVVIPRLGDSATAPPVAGSTSPSSSTVKPADGSTLPRVNPPVQIPAPDKTMDRGPATEAQARKALRSCASSPGIGWKPADADTATIRLARWADKPVTLGMHPDFDTRPARQLVVNAVRAGGQRSMYCVDDQNPGGAIPVQGGSAELHSNLTMPITGGGGGGRNNTAGHWYVEYSAPFNVVAGVARVDLRLTWNGGASPWRSAVLRGRLGYADLAATGSSAVPRGVKVEVRLVDADDYLLYRWAGPIDMPIGFG